MPPPAARQVAAASWSPSESSVFAASRALSRSRVGGRHRLEELPHLAERPVLEREHDREPRVGLGVAREEPDLLAEGVAPPRSGGRGGRARRRAGTRAPRPARLPPRRGAVARPRRQRAPPGAARGGAGPRPATRSASISEPATAPGGGRLLLGGVEVAAAERRARQDRVRGAGVLLHGEPGVGGGLVPASAAAGTRGRVPTESSPAIDGAIAIARRYASAASAGRSIRASVSASLYCASKSCGLCSRIRRSAATASSLRPSAARRYADSISAIAPISSRGTGRGPFDASRARRPSGSRARPASSSPRTTRAPAARRPMPILSSRRLPSRAAGSSGEKRFCVSFGSLREVVELGLRAVDVVVAPVPDRPQRAPAQVDARVEGLGVQAPLRVERARRASAARRRRAAEALPGRRPSVGSRSTSATGSFTVSPARAEPGQLDEQRDVERLAVEEDAVLLLAVLAQPLAVIREQDHDRAVVEAAAPQLPDEVAHDRVGRRDLAVVGARSRSGS